MVGLLIAMIWDYSDMKLKVMLTLCVFSFVLAFISNVLEKIEKEKP